MENKLDKKTLISVVIASVTLLTLIVGATYAYFTINSTNSFGTKNLSAEIEDMADNAILIQENNTLSLNVSRIQMSETNKGAWYYASGSAIPANIGKITVDGEGSYLCTYQINVTKSATNDLYAAFKGMDTKSKNQIYFQINDNIYDFDHYRYYFDEYDIWMYEEADLFPVTYSGTSYGITKDNPGYITANIAILNGDINQDALKGKDITLTFNISDFKCEIEPEYTKLALTSEYMDDIGYGHEWNTGQVIETSANVIIPKVFKGKDGVWYKVTSTEISLFDSLFDIESITLPENIIVKDNSLVSAVSKIYIPKNITFEGMALGGTGITDVYYKGSEDEWNALVSKHGFSNVTSFWESITNYGDFSTVTMHYNGY